MSEFSRLVYVDKNGDQWRLTVSTFRDVEYLHIRKYYLTMDEEWKPTKDGLAIPFTINNSWALFFALTELLASAEVNSAVDMEQLITDYEQGNNTKIPRAGFASLLQRDSDNT